MPLVPSDGRKHVQQSRIIKILQSRYIVVKADQDSRPDLSNRYEDYGWPATVVFNADGQEIVKRRGYLPPAEMISMLQAIIDDPSPGPSAMPAPRCNSLPILYSAPRRSDAYHPKARGWIAPSE